MAVAAHIASGMADTGIGVETAAHRFGLDFIPLARERYFFAMRKSALDLPAMQALLAIMRGGDYKSYVGQLVGYDATGTGGIQTLQEAFG
jgi:molybdate-binding protein